MARLIFHDFDYINPLSNLPEGDTLENLELRHQVLMQTTGSYGAFKAFGGNDEVSPGKSVYISELGSDQNRPRLGGHKTNIRALQNVQPLAKRKELSPRLRSIMKERLSSLEPKTKKLMAPKKLPKIENRKKQMSKILMPLIKRKNHNPWIPSGNTSSIYTQKLSAFEGGL